MGRNKNKKQNSSLVKNIWWKLMLNLFVKVRDWVIKFIATIEVKIEKTSTKDNKKQKIKKDKNKEKENNGEHNK